MSEFTKVTGPLIQADVVDRDGHFFSREVLEKAVENYNEKVLKKGTGIITSEFRSDLASSVGFVEKMEMDENTVDVTGGIRADLKEPFEQNVVEFAMGGVIEKSHEEERDGKTVKVIDELRIKDVTLTKHKVK